jgi:hypothetical protein
MPAWIKAWGKPIFNLGLGLRLDLCLYLGLLRLHLGLFLGQEETGKQDQSGN